MTSKQHAEMKRLWAQNYPVKIIARKLGLKESTIQNHAAYYRDEFPARRRSRHITPDEAREMKRMRESGATHREIAERFGCRQETVVSNIRRLS